MNILIIGSREHERMLFRSKIREILNIKSTSNDYRNIIRNINIFEKYNDIKISIDGSKDSLIIRIVTYILDEIDPYKIMLRSKGYGDRMCTYEGCIIVASYNV